MRAGPAKHEADLHCWPDSHAEHALWSENVYGNCGAWDKYASSDHQAIAEEACHGMPFQSQTILEGIRAQVVNLTRSRSADLLSVSTMQSPVDQEQRPSKLHKVEGSDVAGGVPSDRKQGWRLASMCFYCKSCLDQSETRHGCLQAKGWPMSFISK